MNVDWLQKQHEAYLHRFDYSLKAGGSGMFDISNYSYQKIRDSLGDISEEAKDEAIERMIYRNRQTDSLFVQKIFKAANITPYRYAKITGIEKSIIRQVISMERSLPIEQFFAIALVFTFSWEHVTQAMEIVGISLTNEFQNVIFEQFIKNERYCLGDFVETVRDTAETLKNAGKDIVLPAFYDKEYLNANIPVKK